MTLAQSCALPPPTDTMTPDLLTGAGLEPGLDLGDGRVRLDAVEDERFDPGVAKDPTDLVDDAGRG